jgi:hypothetical protein
MRALILDPSHEHRSTLFLSLKAAECFESIRAASELGKDESHLSEFDVVYISSRYPEHIAVSLAREAQSYQVWTVMTAPARGTGPAISSNLLREFDGVLFEPYTIDEVSRTAVKNEDVPERSPEGRMYKAMEVLVAELRSLQSFIAASKVKGRKAGIAELVFREMAECVRAFEDNLQLTYFMALFAEYQETKSHPQGAYRGSSQRVRSLVSRKALTEVRKVLNG